MKRLLALLLALLLPGGALAEAWCADAALSVDEAYFAALLTPSIAAMTGLDASGDAAALTKVAAGLVNGLSLHVKAQEDAALVDLRLGGKAFIDFAVHMDAKQMIITSDLMRGYGLTLPVEESETVPVMDAVDWQQLAAGMLEAAAKSLSGIEHTFAHGAFAGDAYSGGAYCDTWVLDDSDVAALLTSLLTGDVRETVAALLAAAGEDADALLSELDALHQQAAERNGHAYIVRIVSDAEFQPIGLSLTVLRGEAQLATISCGIREDSLRIVLGAGGDDVNHWYDGSIRSESDTSWSGTIMQFTGAKDESFAYAAAVAYEPISLLTWTLDMNPTDAGFSWRYAHEADGSGYALPERVVSTGECGNGAVSSETTLLLDGRELAVLTVSAAPCEAIPAVDEGLTLCDLSSTDEEQLLLQDELADMMAQIFSMRVMMLLPMDVLTLLQ